MTHPAAGARVAPLRQHERGGTPKPELRQWEILEQSHERAAALLAQLWRLPPELSVVLANHHAAAQELPRQHPAVSVVALAEHFAGEYGAGIDALFAKSRVKVTPSLECVEPARTGAARQVLRLTDATFAHLHKDVGVVLEHLAQQG